MTANKILNALDRAVTCRNLDGDCHRILVNEANTIRARIQTGGNVSAAIAEAKRVAEMWGVAL